MRLARGRCCTQETAAGANSVSVFDRCAEPGRRCAVDLSRLALIFRVLPNETQARSQFAIDTRNIPELGISLVGLIRFAVCSGSRFPEQPGFQSNPSLLPPERRCEEKGMLSATQTHLAKELRSQGEIISDDLLAMSRRSAGSTSPSTAITFGPQIRSKMTSGHCGIRAQHSSTPLGVRFRTDSAMTPFTSRWSDRDRTVGVCPVPWLACGARPDA